jgi:hypothetical protein
MEQVVSTNRMQIITGATVALIVLGIAGLLLRERNSTRGDEKETLSADSSPERVQRAGPIPEILAAAMEGWKPYEFPEAEIKFLCFAEPKTLRSTPNGSLKLKCESEYLGLSVMILKGVDSKLPFEQALRLVASEQLLQDPKPSTLAGKPAIEYRFVDNSGVVRAAVIDEAFYFVGLDSRRFTGLAEEAKARFFENFQLLGKRK